jgi:hypothetical protein
VRVLTERQQWVGDPLPQSLPVELVAEAELSDAGWRLSNLDEDPELTEVVLVRGTHRMASGLGD